MAKVLVQITTIEDDKIREDLIYQFNAASDDENPKKFGSDIVDLIGKKYVVEDIESWQLDYKHQDDTSEEEKEIEQYLSKKDQELITEYSQDFSTDKAYGQLSVVQILRETIADLVSRIPEIERLSEKRRNAIEEQIMLFNLSIFDQGKQEANEQAKIDADYRKIAQSE